MKRYIVLLLLFAFNHADAEIRISKLTDSEKETIEFVIGKLVLQGGMISFVAPDGTILASEKMSEVRSIVLSNSTTTVIQATAQSEIRIFPNPACDYIQVEGVGKEVNYRVYDLTGKCVEAGNGRAIPVSELGSGTYILQVGTQMVKFIKE